MKLLTSLISRPAPTLKGIEEFEALNNIHLPVEYKDFLVNQNLVKAKECRLPWRQDFIEIHQFYPFLNDYDMSVQEVFGRINHYFESRYFPFANSAGDDQYLICIQENCFGKIYLSTMDDELENTLVKLSDSFEEFIDRLVAE